MLRERFCYTGLILVLCLSGSAGLLDAAETWQAGVARSVITPPEYMWMSGYGGRTAPADGAIQDLYVRVACLQDASGGKSLFVSLDLVGVPVKMSRQLSQEFKAKYGIPRANVMFTCSHTHCGPALDHMLSYMLAMTEDDWKQVREYQLWLNDRIRETVANAIADLSDAEISFDNSVCGFACNRRAPLGQGPVDHQVPVLKIAAPGGKVRGIIFGYACHNTTLGIQQWCGDYAGFAQLDLEEHYPDSVAMFFSGCGGDQNPLPRRKLELCQQYGRLLSISVREVVDGTMEPLESSLRARYTEIDLEFASVPTDDELQKKLDSGSRYEKAWAKNMKAEEKAGGIARMYPYPIQVWTLGKKLNWIALGGEVVVDYSNRLKEELGKDTTWVTGYANDVMAYIPSERVLREGGYEGATAMLYYQKPSPWKAGLEDQIVETVHKLLAP